MRTVSNTSPISNLAIIEQPDLSREQFGEVWIPEAVFAECDRIPYPATHQLILGAIGAGWLIVRPVEDTSLVGVALSGLHRGESEAIALAVEMKAGLLLIDERDGRQVARGAGLNVRGILGILLRAKKTGRLSAIRPSIQMLKDRARFFVAPELEEGILRSAGE